MTLAIRSRLAVWYAVVLGLLLALFAGALYLAHSRSRIARVDDDLGRAGALLGALIDKDLEEGLTLSRASSDALEDIVMPGRSLAIFDERGALLSGAWPGLPVGVAAALGVKGEAWTSVDSPAGRFRVYQARHPTPIATFQVGVAESLAPVEIELETLRRTIGVGVLLALLVAAGGGRWIARAALRPLAVMAGEAGGITAQTPGSRLASPHPRDELGRLAGAFNDLLDRLEKALAQQRQFMADASHELRTPVSIARTATDVTLGRDGRSEAEYRESLFVVREQMKRLTRVVDDLLTLARADAAGLPLDCRPLYLDELVAEGVRDSAVLAEPKGVHLDSAGPSGLEVAGDETLLRKLLGNLLDNAVRHTPPGGRVRVDLAVREGAVELSVTDTGGGIAEAEGERIFQRFVRLAGQDTPGAGLGLPIARAIAEAHGGTLTLAGSDGGGSTFLARLPLRPPPA